MLHDVTGEPVGGAHNLTLDVEDAGDQAQRPQVDELAARLLAMFRPDNRASRSKSRRMHRFVSYVAACTYIRR